MIQLEPDEFNISPQYGGMVIARAWTDAAFKARLLDDAKYAVREFVDIGDVHYQLHAKENTADVHNMIVCTPCSCYPIDVLGPVPEWYKSAEYRARAIADPSNLLMEWGTIIPPWQRIDVWDSTADRRYMVIPRRPAGTLGWSQADLASLIKRDHLIGVAILKLP